jgi:hypothetical protein
MGRNERGAPPYSILPRECQVPEADSGANRVTFRDRALSRHAWPVVQPKCPGAARAVRRAALPRVAGVRSFENGSHSAALSPAARSVTALAARPRAGTRTAASAARRQNVSGAGPVLSGRATRAAAAPRGFAIYENEGDGRNGESIPCWYVQHPLLRSDDPPGSSADVVVVGAGIAGLSVACQRGIGTTVRLCRSGHQRR